MGGALLPQLPHPALVCLLGTPISPPSPVGSRSRDSQRPRGKDLSFLLFIVFLLSDLASGKCSKKDKILKTSHLKWGLYSLNISV